MECDICGKMVYSDKDGSITPTHTRECIVICNECREKLKKKVFEERNGKDDGK